MWKCWDKSRPVDLLAHSCGEIEMYREAKQIVPVRVLMHTPRLNDTVSVGVDMNFFFNSISGDAELNKAATLLRLCEYIMSKKLSWTAQIAASVFLCY
jgi:hypothetical protein